jgi:hypothetical protein
MRALALPEACYQLSDCAATVLTCEDVPTVLLRGLVVHRGDAFAVVAVAAFGVGTASPERLFLPAGIAVLHNFSFSSSIRMRSVFHAGGSALREIGRAAFATCRVGVAFVPRTVEAIGADAFYGCRQLQLLHFEAPARVGAIGAGAFKNCGVTEVAIPANVTTIGEECFHKCDRLVRLLFEHGSRLAVMERVFVSSRRLAEILIPDGVRIMRPSCFGSCPQLVRVVFGRQAQIEEIGMRALRYTALSAVCIPQRAVICAEAFPDNCVVSRGGPINSKTVVR